MLVLEAETLRAEEGLPLSLLWLLGESEGVVRALTLVRPVALTWALFETLSEVLGEALTLGEVVEDREGRGLTVPKLVRERLGDAVGVEAKEAVEAAEGLVEGEETSEGVAKGLALLLRESWDEALTMAVREGLVVPDTLVLPLALDAGVAVGATEVEAAGVEVARGVKD